MNLTDRNTAAIKSMGCCWYCGRNEWSPVIYPTIDHQTPRLRDGSDLSGNLVRACNECNTAKGGRTLEEYRYVVAGAIFEMALLLGNVKPPIPKVVFFGESVRTSKAVPKHCREMQLSSCYEKKLELLSRWDDSKEVRQWKKNRRRKLRHNYGRIVSTTPSAGYVTIQHQLRAEFKRRGKVEL